MNYTYEKNIMLINEKRLVFDYDISVALNFSDYIVILLSAPVFSYDEVYAINFTGEVVWNIADIIPYNVPEIYTNIKKDEQNEDILIAFTYSGMKFWIDTTKNQIVKQLLVR